MDQLGEKEEHSSQEPSDHRRKRKGDAAAAVAVPEGVHGESTDQRDGAEAAGVIKEKEQAVGVPEEEAPAPVLAHPCSLLQLLLRACAGYLAGLLHGNCNDDDPKPAADDFAAAVAVAESPQQEGLLHGYCTDDDQKPAAEDFAAAAAVAESPQQEGLLHGYCTDDDQKPAADDFAAAAAAVVESPQEGKGDDGKAADSHLYVQEVATQLSSARPPPAPPGPPAEGPGDHGGSHN